MNKTNIVSILVHFGGVATIARATSLAVNNDLSVQGNWRESSLTFEASQNVKSISNC
jgi:hypothetical protein